jgi:predicted metalloprotease with PDZ domain
MKMGDLDKVLDEITDMDVKEKKSSAHDDVAKGSWNINDVKTKESSRQYPSSFEDSTASIVSDEIVDDDGCSGPSEALAQMQQELKEAEERQKKEAAEAAATASTASLLVQATDDKVVTATIFKPTPESPIGISMKTSNGVTRIVSVSETGLLKDSDLRSGLQMVEINGVEVKNAKHARYLIQACQDKVTIVTYDLSIEV